MQLYDAHTVNKVFTADVAEAHAIGLSHRVPKLCKQVQDWHDLPWHISHSCPCTSALSSRQALGRAGGAPSEQPGLMGSILVTYPFNNDGTEGQHQLYTTGGLLTCDNKTL